MGEISYLRPPVVWLLTDDKPGHRNQLRGIGERLRALAGAELIWIQTQRHPVSLWRTLLGLAAPLPYPNPNIIIAAGTGTHRLLLSLRRKPKVTTVVMMRPSFPTSWVDAAIIPAHDSPAARPEILVTQGAVNAVTPLAESVCEPEGLILLGGPSRHFVWDDDIIYEQISILSDQYPDWNWRLSSSRRTPESLIRRIRKSNLPRIRFYHHEDTGPDWLADTMAKVRVIWVSPDSAAMVYEALTAGIPTGLLELEPSGGSRVAQGLVALERQGRVAPWADRMALMKADPAMLEPLWEADRAARWVLQRWQQKVS